MADVQVPCMRYGNRHQLRAGKVSMAPRRNGRGAVGGRQAALGLLRDQIRSCVPSSFSIRRA